MRATGSTRDTTVCVINIVVSIDPDCTDVAGVMVMDRLFRGDRVCAGALQEVFP